MKAIQKLRELGQSLWIDNITRDLLNSGLLEHSIKEWSVTGLTFNLSAFEHAIQNSTTYDADICKKLKQDILGQELFYELALEDLRYSADLFRSVYHQTDGMGGWVSIDLWPFVFNDPESTLAAAKDLHSRVRRPNVLINIPGTKENLSAVEEAIFTGVPVNINFLFSREHYLAATEAFRKGINRRISAGLKPSVGSFASLSVSDWDTAVVGKVPAMWSNRLGIAIAMHTYKASQEVLNSPGWQRILNYGAQPQRLLWANTGAHDPNASEFLYVKALAFPFTINTVSEENLRAIGNRGDIGASIPVDGGNCEDVLSRFDQFGIDIDTLADQLQNEGVTAYIKSWFNLMTAIASKSATLAQGFLEDTIGGYR